MSLSDADFSDFVDGQTRRLLALAYAMTGDSNDAWDLLQESLVRVGVRWSRLRDQNPAGYATTVMVHLNIDRLRKLQREVLTGRDHSDGEAVPMVECDMVEPWLLDGLATLSPRQRTVLALRFIEDLSLADIAERIGSSEGTVKSHLSRGLSRLRDHAVVQTSHEGVGETYAQRRR